MVKFAVLTNILERMLEITVNDNRKYTVEQTAEHWMLNDKEVDFDVKAQPNGLISVLYNGKSYTAAVEQVDFTTKQVTLVIDGHKREMAISEPMDQLLASMGLDMSALQQAEPVKAPMPGMILKILVEPGQQISKGDGLLVLEAMKMENVLKSSGDATVKSINVKEQTAVEKGAILIEME